MTQQPQAPMCSKAQAETLKWIGLACMLSDHLCQFLGLRYPGWELVGTAAMPAFALALGAQLTQHHAGAAAKRLLYWGLLVLPVYYWACWPTQTHPDILIGLACAAGWIAAEDDPPKRRWAIRGALFVAAFASDFGQTAIMLASAAREKRRHYRYTYLALGTLGLYMWNGGIGAGWGIAWYAASRYLPGTERTKRFFLRAYAIQWPLLAVARIAGA